MSRKTRNKLADDLEKPGNTKGELVRVNRREIVFVGLLPFPHELWQSWQLVLGFRLLSTFSDLLQMLDQSHPFTVVECITENGLCRHAIVRKDHMNMLQSKVPAEMKG